MGYSKVQSNSSQTVQTKIQNKQTKQREKKEAMPLCLLDSKGVWEYGGDWLRVSCSVLMKD